MSKQVLLSIPPNFDLTKQISIIVFLHGNQATLARDVARRQKIVEQVADAHINAVLVAPQFAVNALDSSAGAFWQRGVFNKFLSEAAHRLAAMSGDSKSLPIFESAPIILIAYSGGYNPAAYILDGGELNNRLCGVFLFDALFGETDRFASWAQNDRRAFFVSAFSKSSAPENHKLQAFFQRHGIPFQANLGSKSTVSGSLRAFIEASKATHNDFMTDAWTKLPLKALLSRTQACQNVRS